MNPISLKQSNNDACKWQEAAAFFRSNPAADYYHQPAPITAETWQRAAKYFGENPGAVVYSPPATRQVWVNHKGGATVVDRFSEEDCGACFHARKTMYYL
ncbi:hypothetical protein [Parasitella parasitica]|uniref:Uncharacterized protein n=1 Tax=Parasitella parasitica TaxID=35722 RepID=A0A0B7NJ73_9FUNG|nr:hypothetical protein [Parasitella parasitica]